MAPGRINAVMVVRKALARLAIAPLATAMPRRPAAGAPSSAPMASRLPIARRVVAIVRRVVMCVPTRAVRLLRVTVAPHLRVSVAAMARPQAATTVVVVLLRASRLSVGLQCG